MSGWSYNAKKHREAVSKEEQCKADIHIDMPTNDNLEKKKIKEYHEKKMKEYREYCPKSKSNNFIFCPQHIIKRKKDKRLKMRLQLNNDYFNNLVKKSKKKKTEKKTEKKGKVKKKKKTKRKLKKTNIQI